MRARLLLCAALVACAPPEPEPRREAGPEPEPAARLRLWVDGAAQLHAPAPTGETRLVFSSRFESDLDGWEGIVQPPRGPGQLEAVRGEEAGRAFVRLTGVHGGLHVVFPVEPAQGYTFTGWVRNEGIETSSGTFDGARFWLAQASGEAGFEEFRTTRIDLMTENWRSAQAPRGEGWKLQRRTFVTTPSTHFLHVVCSLDTLDDVTTGSVDFADLRLEALPIEHVWRQVLDKETRARAGIDPPAAGDQGLRRVAAELGGESRPSLVLLPGERLRFPLPALAAHPRLAFGLGAWAPTLLEKKGGHARLHVRGDGQELLTLEVGVPLEAARLSWQPCDLALAPGLAALELELEGDTPIAIGAPRVHTDARPLGRTNVVLVSIDTLRADHVGAYGYGQDTTPNLDRLAARGLLCRDVSSQAPYTLPSHATMLTGQFPSVHGVVAHESRLGAARSLTLAERLAKVGYRTRAFTAGGFVNDVFGLDQGFEAFSEIDPVRERGSHYFRTLSTRHGAEIAGRLLSEQGFEGVERWLRARDDEPFFLFLHTYTVHDYDASRRYLTCAESGCPRPRVEKSTRKPEEAAAFTPEMRAHVQHLYDGALRYTDERLGALLALLDELELTGRTLIVVTSDHGEEFFEHGNLQHGRTLYEEVLRVPLILAGPGLEPDVLERPAMVADVVPTVLGRLGFPLPENLQGKDLLGPAWGPRPIWSEVDSRFAHKYALRDERGPKTIEGPPTTGIQFPNERRWEHYDLADDPGEQHELSGDGSPQLEAARADLERHRRALEALGNSLGAAGHGDLDEEMLRNLSELGYGGEDSSKGD